MSYTNYATGEIYIEPPIPLSEMDSIDVEQYVQGESTTPWYRDRTRERDLRLTVDAYPEYTGPVAAHVLVVRRWEDRNDYLAIDLDRLVKRYGRDHRFVGYLEVEPESGEGNFPYRVQVMDGEAQNVNPIVTWPEGD